MFRTPANLVVIAYVLCEWTVLFSKTPDFSRNNEKCYFYCYLVFKSRNLDLLLEWLISATARTIMTLQDARSIHPCYIRYFFVFRCESLKWRPKPRRRQASLWAVSSSAGCLSSPSTYPGIALLQRETIGIIVGCFVLCWLSFFNIYITYPGIPLLQRETIGIIVGCFVLSSPSTYLGIRTTILQREAQWSHERCPSRVRGPGPLYRVV